MDQTAPTGKKAKDVLSKILSEIDAVQHPSEEIFHYWRTLIGEKMGPLTQPVFCKNGVLTIKVKSATLYALLCQHEKPRLLKALQARFQVRDLVFKVG